MATVSTTNMKYSLRYVSSQSATDGVTKTLSGINIRTQSDATTGPTRDNAITNIINSIELFSVGTLSDVRFIVESEVVR